MKNKVSTLNFRSIKKEDTGELYTLLNGLSDEAKQFFHPHSFDKKTISQICTSKKDHYFVMIQDNTIIGYSFLRLFGYEIPSFGCCIRNGFENKEYGTILTQWTIKKARELGYPKVIIKVYKENEVAFRMYKKIGFKITGENKDTKEFYMEIIL